MSSCSKAIAPTESIDEATVRVEKAVNRFAAEFSECDELVKREKTWLDRGQLSLTTNWKLRWVREYERVLGREKAISASIFHLHEDIQAAHTTNSLHHHYDLELRSFRNWKNGLLL